MNALAFALAFALAGVPPNAVPVEEGTAVPFTGVLLTNERAGELAIAESDGKSCANQIVRTAEITAGWKELAQAKASAVPDDTIVTPGVLVGVGVVVGVGLSIGMYLVAGWTMGLASSSSP